jgi:hypothetical protein
VSDRSNNRIEIFDQDGHYIDHWMHFSRPSSIAIDRSDRMYVADAGDFEHTHPGWPTGIRIGSATDGSLTGFIPGIDPEVAGVDSEGNVYAGFVVKRKIEKYVK